MKIRTRIILSFIFLVAIGFYFLVRHVLEELRPRYLEAVEEVLVDEANLLASFLESEMVDARIPIEKIQQSFVVLRTRKFNAKIYKLLKTRVDERLYITDAKGIVIFDSEGQDQGKDFSQWLDVYLTLQGKYGARTTRDEAGNPSTSVLHVAAPIFFQGRIVGVLTLRKPTTNINFFLDTARPSFVIAGTVAALAVILLGSLLSIWVTGPIRRLTDYARAVRDGRPVIFPKLGSSEIAEMGKAFEGMREALEGKKYIENYVQSLTHELKGPIAAVQGAAELLQEDVPAERRSRLLANIRAESKRMHQIVEHLLELASLESRRELKNVEDISCQDLIEKILERLQPQLAAKSLQIEPHLPAALLRGERFLLESAVQNLLQNAIDFSPVGGLIRLDFQEEAKTLSLKVSDQGPGIPDYALPQLFERFYSLPRPDTGKKSSGLGLSFVREVARLHGGEIELKNLTSTGAMAMLTLRKIL